MKLVIDINPRAVEYLIERRYEEAAAGCYCWECAILTSLVCAVLELTQEEECLKDQ